MWILFCYLLGFVPLAAAAGLWFFSKKITWWEALVLPTITTLIVLGFHSCAINGMTDDIETWSGQVTEAVYTPSWVEYYEYAVYRTEYYTTTETYSDSKGHHHTRTVRRSRQVFDHWQPTTRHHNEEWGVTETLNGNYNIDKPRYDDIVRCLGQIKAHPGIRRTGSHNSRFQSGDPMDYSTVNINAFVYPVNCTKTWKNKVKAAPSVFSYAKVPETAKVFEYPKNPDKFTSGRVVGTTGITTFNWDQMNSRLGPSKKVNIIVVGFKDEPEDISQLQEAKWFGGKKNDVVICFGGSDVLKPSWVYVFGWSESDLCKKNLESIILKNGMNNDTIILLEKEIDKNYVIKEWKKFDYLTVEVPFKYYIWLIIFLVVFGGGWILFSFFDDVGKDDP